MEDRLRSLFNAITEIQALDSSSVQAFSLSLMFRGLLQEREALNAAELAAACDFVQFILDKRAASKSQLFQDLLVLFVLNEKRGGYFIEAGAADGIGLSNSYLLETGYGWTGIAAEPARSWRDKLTAHRKC